MTPVCELLLAEYQWLLFCCAPLYPPTHTSLLLTPCALAAACWFSSGLPLRAQPGAIKAAQCGGSSYYIPPLISSRSAAPSAKLMMVLQQQQREQALFGFFLFNEKKSRRQSAGQGWSTALTYHVSLYKLQLQLLTQNCDANATIVAQIYSLALKLRTRYRATS